MGSRAGHDVLRDARVSRSGVVSRSNDDLITEKLASAWPAVSIRLATMLRRRGVGRHDADEVIQETAARAMTSNVEFVDADDLFRWASVVSWRIAIDARRRCTRLTGGEVPDRADHVDVAQAAEHRIVLSAVTTRFKELSERDQAVLLASFGDQQTSNRVEAVRLAVARHRARNRLRGLLNGLAAPVVAFLVRRGRFRSAQLQAFASTAAPAFACFALTLGAVVGPTPAPQSQPRPVSALSVASAAPASHEATAPPVVVAPTGERVRASTPTTPPPTGLAGGVQIVAAPGQPTSAGFRPKQATDHVACLTVPSLTGPRTACVDAPPAPGR